MPRQRRAAVSLIELLIVIAIISLMAATVIPSSSPTIHEQLYAAAQVVAADAEYCRSLATTRGSPHRLSFDLDANSYTIEHSGTDPALDALPQTALYSPDDPPDAHEIVLADLPGIRVSIEAFAALTTGTSPKKVDEVQFGPLGGTTESEDTAIWLAAGEGSERRYLSVRVHAVTGLTTIEDFRAAAPVVPSDPVSLPDE